MEESDEESDLEPEYTGMRRPTLIQELSKILDEYPDDGQILKELIQNAEDASASEMKILYDTRSIGQQCGRSRYSKYFQEKNVLLSWLKQLDAILKIWLHHLSSRYSEGSSRVTLEECLISLLSFRAARGNPSQQGPALCIYNNALFTDEDWEGIKQIGHSIKELDPSRVGRFGLGFKSVFHITDYPMIISGQEMLIIDPHCDESRCCIPFCLEQLGRYKGFNLTECAAALDGVFGFKSSSKSERFKGTVFRFPLRQKETELSDSVYSHDKIRNLLDVLEKEAATSLLFLKTLESINIYNDYQSMLQNKPDYMVNIGGTSLLETRQLRNDMQAKSIPNHSVEKCFILTIETQNKGASSESQSFLVVNRLEGLQEGSKELISLAKSLAYLPYIGVALPLECSPSFKGHIFCFLPLPMQEVSASGLPLHINAQFALSQNRQHLKWADIYTHKYKENSVKWNECLVSQLLPKVYTSLIEFMCTQPNSVDWISMVMQVLPDPDEVDTRFKPCIDSLYERLCDFKFLYTESNGGKWITWRDAIFPIPDCNNSSDMQNAVIRTLQDYNVNLVHSHQRNSKVYGILSAVYLQSPKAISPDLLCRVLKSDIGIYRDFVTERKMLLLFYLASRDYKFVIGLELLPLANGSFATFMDNSFGKYEPVFVCNPPERKDLFPGMESRILHQLPEEIYTVLLRLARSEKSQLRLLDNTNIPRLLSKCIDKQLGPSEGKQCLIWKTSCGLTDDWLQSVWQFLYMNYTDLSITRGLHILPQVTGKTRYLHTMKQLLLVAEDNRQKLPSAVKECLEALSVVVLPKLPIYIEQHRNVLDNIVERPTVDGVLRVLMDEETISVSKFNRCVTGASREKFVSFLSTVNNISNEKVLTVLKSLQLFHTSDNRGFLSIGEENRITPSDWIPVPLPDRLIKCKSPDEIRLAKLLGAKEMKLNDAVRSILTCLVNGTHYDQSEMQKIMKYFMSKILVFQQDLTAMQLARTVKFVASCAGPLKCPDDLYDPRDPLLKQMLCSDEMFPRTSQAEELNVLRKLGLKTSSELDSFKIYQICKSLHSRSCKGERSSSIITQAEALLKILTKHIDLLEQCYQGSKIKQLLADLRICPSVMKMQSYPPVLKWFSNESILCRPKEFALKEAVTLIGSTMPVCSDDYSDVIRILHPNVSSPPLSKVAEQLHHIAQQYSDRNKSELQLCVKNIYTFMNNNDIDDKLLRNLMENQTVWIGDGFCRPNIVYIESKESDLHLQPYIYPIQPEFKAMKKLFRRLNCSQQQSPEMLIEVLERIKGYHAQNRSRGEHNRDLGLAINILNHFKDVPDADQYNLLFPVQSPNEDTLLLKPANECNYCNADWLKDMAEEDGEDIYFVHQDISTATASALGVKSLTDSLVADTGLLDWEQEISLVSRIKTLLKGYRDGLSVPKELIQNADDAGATKVCFLFDERENLECRTKLLNENMSECQGPALWAFNDATFTESDLRNITKVEGATKENDLSKVGKFGVGFCSVYNLTDVPSFVSGQNMVIFDPQGTYLSKSGTKGMNIDFKMIQNQTLLRRMSNQFKPFNNVFGCDLNTQKYGIPNFEGTLFRFPLRTKGQASSKISDIVYDRSEMRKLLNIFTQSAGNLVLFTQNVSEIEVYHLPAKETDPSKKKLIFQVRRHVPEKISATAMPLLNGNQILTLRNCAEKIKKCQNVASFPEFSLVYSVDIELIYTSHGTQFHDQPEKNINTSWLVSWAEGNQDCLKLSTNRNFLHALPMAASAMLICRNKDDRKIVAKHLSSVPHGFYKTGHLFCVLPLPIETSFQFHISGCFAVTQDRKQLSVETVEDKQRFESEWNEAVMKDAVLNAIMKMLGSLQTLEIHPGENVVSFWPVVEHSSFSKSCASCIQFSFIKALINLNPDVIFQKELGLWTHFSCCKFLDQTLLTSEIWEIAFQLSLEFYSQSNHYVVNIPDWLMHLFQSQTEMKDQIITTETFYSEVFFPFLEIGKLNDVDRDKLLIHAVDLRDPKIDEMLKKTKCFPTSTGKLSQLSVLTIKSSSVGHLFLDKEDRFLLQENKYLERHAIFKRLGIMHNSLPDVLLIERFKSIESLSKQCSFCALQRCQDVLRFCQDTTISDAVLSAVKFIKFLPVMMKPSNWNSKWKAEDIIQKTRSCEYSHIITHAKTSVPNYCAMESPTNLFFSICKDIIGCDQLLLDFKSIINYTTRGQLQSFGVQGFSTDNVPFNAVVNQLVCLTSVIDTSQKCTFLDHALKPVYNWLDTKCKIFDDDDKNQEKSVLKSFIDKPILFIKDQLWKPSQVAYNLKPDCRPHVIGIDESDTSLKRNKKLLSYLGVKDRFCSNDIAVILKDFQSGIDKTLSLDKDTLQQNCNLLAALYESMIAEQIEGKTYPFLKSGEVLIPDIDSHLCKVSDLCLDDDKLSLKSPNMRFVSGFIPPAHAEVFGIKSKKRKAVSSLHKPLKFGQREELTTRIRRILDGYPRDEGILKELLQNADDAGASEIHFISDFNCYPTQHVFEGEWKSLQGPALLVYNNSSFSESDLDGIQNLGIGSKNDDPTKTGQYGVGFNAVYHLTDVPSFITKGPNLQKGKATLCILDPQCKYAEESDQHDPGARYTDLDVLQELEPDVLKPYHTKQLIKKDGTVFRLPLRTPAMAKHSKISSEKMTEEDVKALIKLFQQEAFNCLLFLKDIRKISFSDMKQDNIVHKYSVEVQMSTEDVHKKKIFNDQRKKAGENFKRHEGILSFPVLTCNTTMHLIQHSDENKVSREEDWYVVERFGFDKFQIPEDVRVAFQKGDIRLFPQGGVAMPLSPTQCKSFKAFCFLPLPVNTNFPMHINGHFALNHESRRNLWEDDKENYKVSWNKVLMTAVIAPSYLEVVGYQRNICQLLTKHLIPEELMKSRLKTYLTTFPLFHEMTDSYWKYLAKEIYKGAVEDKQLFPTIADKKLINVDGKFIHHFCLDFICLKDRSKVFPAVFCTDVRRTSVAYLLKLQNLRVIDFASSLFSEMKKCGIDVMELSPGFAIDFLRSFNKQGNGTCEVRGLEKDVTETSVKNIKNVEILLSYCQKSEFFLQKMNGLPLCVTNNGVLTVFSCENPVFCTEHCGIMKEIEDQFLHRNLTPGLLKFIGESPCLKVFSVEEFSTLLSCVLSTEKYGKYNSVQWDPDSRQIPNKIWIQKVWKFLHENVTMEKAKQTPEKTQLEQFQKLLENWCIIPAKCSNLHYLVSLHQSISVLDYSTFYSNKILERAIMALDLPLLNVNIFLENVSAVYPSVSDGITLVKKCIVSCTNCCDILNCFLYHLKNKGVAISKENCNAIAEYFNDNLDMFRGKKESFAEKLRSLPIYVTVSGTNTCLQLPAEMMILPSGFPCQGINEWAESSWIVLLEENDRIRELHAFLELSNCGILNVYANYIIPNFHHMPEAHKHTHLLYVRDELINRGNYDSSEVHKHLKVALENCCFLVRNERKCCAKDFYSPFLEVYQVMLPDDSMFPPEPYNKKEWREFMELIGMRKTVPPDVLLNFAHEVQNEGLSIHFNEKTVRKSSVLVKHVMERENLQSELEHGPLCNIRDIKFIVPKHLSECNNLVQIHGQYKDNNLISFNNSVKSENMNLVWTSANVLPHYASSFSCKHTKKIFELLGIKQQPSTIQVVRNIQNISDSINSKELSFFSAEMKCLIHDIFKSHYRFLQTHHWDEPDVKKLQEKPIVFLEDEMKCVLCRQVVFGLSSKHVIKPYLFRVPFKYGEFNELFKFLGARDEITAENYAEVLSSLYLDTEGEILNPNERKVLQQAMHFLFFFMRETLNVKELYLPSREFKLCPSQQLLVSDSKEIEDRISGLFASDRFFVGFQHLSMYFDDTYSFQLFPKQLKPSILSEVIDEITVDCIHCENGGNVRRFINFLKTDEFVEGILRLVFDERIANYSYRNEHDNQMSDDEQSTIINNLNNIKVKQVSVLNTALQYNGQRIEKSIKRIPSHFEHKKENDREVWILYILDYECTLQKWIECIEDDLTNILIEVTNCQLLTNQRHIYRLLNCISHPEEISKVLDKAKVKKFKISAEYVRMFPDPGTFVPLYFHHQLDNKFTDFEIGEYVALLVYEEEFQEGIPIADNVYIYAVVRGKCEGQCPVLCEIAEIAQMQKLYLLDIGSEIPEQYAAYKMFKFYRRRDERSTDVTPAVNISRSQTSQPLDATLLEVQRHFLAIMDLDVESERRILIRRFRARWHPDNNYGNEELATRVFQHLEDLIHRWNRGIPIDGQSSRTGGNRGADIPEKFYQRPPPRQGQHARCYTSHSAARREKMPIPQLARKWLRQAEFDILAAENMETSAENVQGYNWVCYQCHQAIEKSLKAVWYSRDAHHAETIRESHELSHIAKDLSAEFVKIAQDIEQVVGHHTRMRYPDQHHGTDIPAITFDKVQASQCLKLAKDMVELTSRNIKG